MQRVAVDTNVLTREKMLQPFLTNNPERFAFILPEIIYLEWAYYYCINGYALEIFQEDIKDMKGNVQFLDQIQLNSIIELAIKNDWILVDVVVWDQTNQRKLVKLGGPKARRFYFNIGHSYIVIFRKNIRGEKFINV